jgi:hypothetical protein
MRPKIIVTLLILSAFAAAGANLASAQGAGFRDDGFQGGDSNVHRRGSHGRDFYGLGFGGEGYGYGGYGYGGYGDDWYGISSGHDECPLFSQRVMTPDGWRIRKIPVC